MSCDDVNCDRLPEEIRCRNAPRSVTALAQSLADVRRTHREIESLQERNGESPRMRTQFAAFLNMTLIGTAKPGTMSDSMVLLHPVLSGQSENMASSRRIHRGNGCNQRKFATEITEGTKSGGRR